MRAFFIYRSQPGLAGTTSAVETGASSGKLMLAGGIMPGIAYVAPPISGLIAMKVVERPFSATRQRTSVAVMRIEAIVYVAIETARSVKPRAGSDKQPSHKPIGSVVSVGRTVIRGIVEVSIWAHRRPADADNNLGRTEGWAAQQGSGESCESECLTMEHSLSSCRLDP